MNILMAKRGICLLVLMMVLGKFSYAQITVNAGADQKICPAASASLGGSPTATGSNPPFTYTWTPAGSLSNATVSNPVATPTTTTIYYLTVKDANGDIAYDTIKITLDSIALVNGGKDTSICENASVTLGGSYVSSDAGITFAWSPATGLSNTTIRNPVASPLVTTTYTLTVKGSTCPSFQVKVVVSVYPPPAISAGPDVTIDEGDLTTLSATGAKVFIWSPTTDLKYPNTPNPEVEPKKTTVYYVFGTDNFGCWGYDSVIVTVRPRAGPVFYNTFSPNGDGVNDVFYIGNLWKYPNNKLEIYNRYGKIVYKADKYTNLWDGKALGEELPAATYYYLFDTGEGGDLYRGSVTIIR